MSDITGRSAVFVNGRCAVSEGQAHEHLGQVPMFGTVLRVKN